MGAFGLPPYLQGIFGLRQAQPVGGMQQAIQQRPGMPAASAIGGMSPGSANMTLGQLLGGMQQMPNGTPQQAMPAIQQPGSAPLGGVLAGLFGRGGTGNPMMPGQQPNLTAPPFAGRFRMF